MKYTIGKNPNSRNGFKKGHIGCKGFLGGHHSETNKEFLSKIQRGKHNSPKTEFKLGHKMPSEIREKIKNTMKGRKPKHIIPENWIKEKNPNWKGGITPINAQLRTSFEYKLWRKAVFERDNFTCKKYGISGGKLHPHHINNFADYPELRFAIDNGITLSKQAHIEFHKKYGKRNNTKEQINEFLNNN